MPPCITTHAGSVRFSINVVTVIALLSFACRLHAQEMSPIAAGGGATTPLWTPVENPGFDSLVPRGPLALLLAGGLATAMSWKAENADRTAAVLDNSWLDGFSDFGDFYGDGVTLGIATLGMLLLGHTTGNGRLSAAGVDMTRSLLASGAVVWGLKFGVNRTRPSGGSYSFPSGHTAAAFAVAPVFEKHFGWKVGVPAYALGVVTAAARMEDHRHYLSDVLFGAAIGVAAGRWAVSNQKIKFLDHLVFSKRRLGVSLDF